MITNLTVTAGADRATESKSVQRLAMNRIHVPNYTCLRCVFTEMLPHLPYPMSQDPQAQCLFNYLLHSLTAWIIYKKSLKSESRKKIKTDHMTGGNEEHAKHI
jgi:hypothetical protein